MSASTSLRQMASGNISPEPFRSPVVVSVVVNFKGAVDTIRCVQSLLATTYPAHRVVVIENGSGTTDDAVIEGRFGDQIELVRAHHNLGYGGGANLGIRWAIQQHAAYVWILNNDTVVAPDAISRLVDAMETSPRLGVASPEIGAPVGLEAPSGVWYAGGVVSLKRAEARHVHRTLERVPGVVSTEYITGCAMFLRCEALQNVGGFWERLFLYWEDVDLSLRFRDSGWGLGVVPLASVTHYAHGSVRADIAERYYFRNAILVARRHGSLRVAAGAVASLGVGLARRWVSAVLRRRPMPQAETMGWLAGSAIALWWTVKRPVDLASGGGSFDVSEGLLGSVSDSPSPRI